MEQEEDEYISMIDYAVALAVRELVAKVVSDEVGIDIMEGRKILIDLLKDERDTPENIRIWWYDMESVDGFMLAVLVVSGIYIVGFICG